MAKVKKKLMIPFTYHHEEMMEYCNFTYQEGEKNSNKKIWNTINNKWTQQPFEPNEFDYRNRPNENYEKEYKYYLKELSEFNENLANGVYIEVENIVWKENYEFEDTLKIAGMSRGRSAANFTFVSETDGKKYNFFMTDMVDMLENAEINKGVVTGLWTFVKRGQNYGVKYLGSNK